jgi:hypothetical protein
MPTTALVATAAVRRRWWLVTRAPVVAAGASSGVCTRKRHPDTKDDAGKHTRNELPLFELQHAAHLPSAFRSARLARCAGHALGEGGGRRPPENLQPVPRVVRRPGSNKLLVAGRRAIVWIPGALAALAGPVASVGRRRWVAGRGPDRGRQHQACKDARHCLPRRELHVNSSPSRGRFGALPRRLGKARRRTKPIRTLLWALVNRSNPVIRTTAFRLVASVTRVCMTHRPNARPADRGTPYSHSRRRRGQLSARQGPLAMRGDPGDDEERRQRDHNVDKGAHDHAAGSPHRCRLG